MLVGASSHELRSLATAETAYYYYVLSLLLIVNMDQKLMSFDYNLITLYP